MTDSVLFVNLRRCPLENDAAVLAAYELGYDVILLSGDRAPTFDGLRSVIRVTTSDHEATLQVAVDAANRNRIAAVVTWSDRDVEVTAAIATKLGLPGLGKETARVLRDKQLLHRSMGAESPLVPRTVLVKTEHEMLTALEKTGLPAILKPVSGSASRGVFQVDSTQEAISSFRALSTYLANEKDPGIARAGGSILVQELLTGTEHSVEGVVHQGRTTILGITDKLTLPPHHMELQHIHPTALLGHARRSVESLAYAVVERTGLRDGVFHIECMVDADGHARLVEAAGRVAGDYIASHLVPYATGVSLYRAAVQVALGQCPDRPSGNPTHAGVRRLVATQPGTLTGVTGAAKVLGMTGVAHLVWENGPTGTIRVPPEDFISPAVAAVIARHPNHQGVQRILESAVAGLTLEYER